MPAAAGNPRAAGRAAAMLLPRFPPRGFECPDRPVAASLRGIAASGGVSPRRRPNRRGFPPGGRLRGQGAAVAGLANPSAFPPFPAAENAAALNNPGSGFFPGRAVAATVRAHARIRAYIIYLPHSTLAAPYAPGIRRPPLFRKGKGGLLFFAFRKRKLRGKGAVFPEALHILA